MDSHRTAHMAGQNYSKLIRQAVLFDYIKKPQYYDDSSPPEDMWRGGLIGGNGCCTLGLGNSDKLPQANFD